MGKRPLRRVQQQNQQPQSDQETTHNRRKVKEDDKKPTPAPSSSSEGNNNVRRIVRTSAILLVVWNCWRQVQSPQRLGYLFHNSTKITSAQAEKDAASFCASPKGSLHQIALDMIHHSSPPGSPSYKKLQTILNQNKLFKVNLGPLIFQPLQLNMVHLLEGYGLQLAEPLANNNASQITLVETQFSQTLFQNSHVHCPTLPDGKCPPATPLQPRILLQSEQTLKHPALAMCHASPLCVLLEFSDFNYQTIRQDTNWADSTVLLPVMMQQPTRLQPFLPSTLPPLHNRSLDIVFYGLITERREVLPALAKQYEQDHVGRQAQITKPGPHALEEMAQGYAQAKVCLVAHSYAAESGGEYHRWSEFAPFGCLPVMERFADQIGMERYQQCGRVRFVDEMDQLIEVATTVVQDIDAGKYDNDWRHVEWWKAGIQWQEILPTVFHRTKEDARG